MRILIAEDDPTSRLVLSRILEKSDHEVVVTTDGDQAWSVLEADPSLDLAILDRMMPGKDGTEVCRMVREMERPVPPYLILLTALGRQEDIVSGFAAGADDYVTKPFNKSELLSRIRAAERIVELQSALSDQVVELQAALDHVATLRGILPICMYCHKIRTDDESWQKIDAYIQEHSEAEISHGICPECLEERYPQRATSKGDGSE